MESKFIVMKTILSVLLSFLMLSAFAQTTFEGVIKWSMTMEGTGTSAQPSTSAAPQMSAQDQAKLQQGITELETQLKDPEMQKMMTENPSMKKMMEDRLAQMKSMQQPSSGTSATSGNSMAPSGFTIKIKNGNTLTKIEGGSMAAMMGDILYLKATDKTYYIKNASKTYSVKPAAASTSSAQGTTKAVATAETMKILNYTCTKYIVTTTNGKEVKTMYVWATKEIKDIDPKSFHGISHSGGNMNSSTFTGIEGVVLRVESTEHGMKMVMQVTNISKQALPSSDFIIPAGYTETTFGH